MLLPLIISLIGAAFLLVYCYVYPYFVVEKGLKRIGVLLVTVAVSLIAIWAVSGLSPWLATVLIEPVAWMIGKRKIVPRKMDSVARNICTQVVLAAPDDYSSASLRDFLRARKDGDIYFTLAQLESWLENPPEFAVSDIYKVLRIEAKRRETL